MFLISFVSCSQIGYYKSITAMAKDVDLMAKNAKTYNEPGSQVFKVPYLSWFSFLLNITS